MIFFSVIFKKFSLSQSWKASTMNYLWDGKTNADKIKWWVCWIVKYPLNHTCPNRIILQSQGLSRHFTVIILFFRNPQELSKRLSRIWLCRRYSHSKFSNSQIKIGLNPLSYPILQDASWIHKGQIKMIHLD